jgi:hypothetical protein
VTTLASRLGELGLDFGNQPLVLCQAKQVIDAVLLAPDDQFVTGKAAISAQQNTYLGPPGRDLAHDPLQFLDRPRRPVDVRTPQLGSQQVPTAGHVERKIAVAIVVSMKEPTLLMPMQRIVSGIEIGNDLPRWSWVGLREELNEKPLDPLWLMADFVIARRRWNAPLEAVERRLAGDRRAILSSCLQLSGEHCHDRVMAMIVVVQVLVAERDPENPLADQRGDFVFDEVLAPGVLEAGRKLRFYPMGARPRPPDFAAWLARPISRPQIMLSSTAEPLEINSTCLTGSRPAGTATTLPVAKHANKYPPKLH